METQQYSHPAVFREAVHKFLMTDEVVNNLPLGVMDRLTESPPVQQPFLAAVYEGEIIRLVLVKTISHLIVAGSQGATLALAARCAVDYILKNDIPLPSVIGQKEVADAFISAWQQRTGRRARVEMRQRIYRLDRAKPVASAPGAMRIAAEADLALLIGWVKDFAAEVLDEVSYGQARELAQRGIAKRSIFIWEDGQPVSMAKKTRPTANGIVLNLVYTPPPQRKNGYATACVASLSQKLLDEGYKFCSLYTDLANPTSNKIYMNIGYYPVTDSIVYRLG